MDGCVGIQYAADHQKRIVGSQCQADNIKKPIDSSFQPLFQVYVISSNTREPLWIVIVERLHLQQNLSNTLISDAVQSRSMPVAEKPSMPTKDVAGIGWANSVSFQ